MPATWLRYELEREQLLMKLRNIQPFEACRFSPGTHGFSGLCSFCGKVKFGRQEAAEYMGQDKRGRMFSLCQSHGQRAIFSPGSGA